MRFAESNSKPAPEVTADLSRSRFQILNSASAFGLRGQRLGQGGMARNRVLIEPSALACRN
jgi:hypothetical protein